LRWRLALVGGVFATTVAIAVVAHLRDPRAASPAAAAKPIASIRVANVRPHYKVGSPYAINGVTYHPREDLSYRRVGIASYYGGERRGIDFHGRPTANGEIYDMYGLTAAHPTLPMPSVVSVTNLENGRSLKLRVNDRGPFAEGRLIDVSRLAARHLGFEEKGTARVRVEVLPEETRALKEAMLRGTR
ncbi:MAG TPA: septal ring lytic transglycosylase RlpA family protein, partial [Alphaproteobacteria bacterium]|nr:septal ring lytic transglycosylase RlpA family protein [Alphaproteobacteria bacterium]